MTTHDAPEHTTPQLQLPFFEFIVLLAVLMAMTALSIDVMLPVLPDIGEAFKVTTPNDRQLVVASYLVGLAVGQLGWGPISDRLGRRPPLLIGLAIFVGAGVAALSVTSFNLLIVARFVQGLGGAAARIVATAIIRDLFSGRQMSRVMSTVMTVFILVPVLAPSVGQAVARFGGWRATFYVLIGVGLLAIAWSGFRLPETRATHGAAGPLGLRKALRLVLGSRATVTYGVASGFTFGCLVTYISSAQQIFVDVFKLGSLFPIAFGAVASAMAIASFTNARFVQRIGMRRLSHSALVAFTLVAGALALIALFTEPPLFVVGPMLGTCFFLFGIVQPNFNAIAMQPVARAAGLAASLIGSYTTAAGAIVGALIARQFDGTVLPLSAGFAILGFCALITVFAYEGASGMFRGE
ncbi:MAG TPA: multidrug effflux MFS transporter [Hyphomicrobiaceae bacterium]|nr:multidrug effflux MFS transporter [Hyphomicrobiaceae bacterium]